MKKRVYLIHGWEGSPEGGWFPWLKQALESQNFEVFSPSMPNTDHPRMDEWVAHLNEVVVEVDEHCYFVGHSLGCITILRYLEKLNPQEKIGGVVLVAGFTSNLGYEALTNFFPDQGQLDWAGIKSHCKKFTAIHSDNDTFVSTHYGKHIFKKYLEAGYILEHDMKHFSGGDGVLELPVVLEAIMEISK